MYDDYSRKLIGKQIEVTFTQVEDIAIFPWEIGYFVNRLNTFYYKDEVLNSISAAINSGVSPENIFMLDRSLPFNQIWANLDILDLSTTGLAQLYKIGNIASLVPNIRLQRLSIMLSLYRSINVFLRANHVRPYFLAGMNEIWAMVKEGSVANGVDALKNRVEGTFRKRRMEKSDSIEELFGNYNRQFIQLDTEIAEITRRLSGLEAGIDLSIVSRKLTKRLYNKYYGYFVSQFDKMARPLIGVFYPEENKVRILGRALVNKRAVNYTTFQLLEARRRSPMVEVFIAGATMITTVLQEERNQEKHEKEMEILDAQLRKATAEAKTAEIEQLSKKIRLYQQLNEIAQESDVLAINALPPSLAKEQLSRAYSHVSYARQMLLEDSGMKLLDDSVRIIDTTA